MCSLLVLLTLDLDSVVCLGGWLTIGKDLGTFEPLAVGLNLVLEQTLFVASIGYFISDHLMFIVLLLYCWFLFVWIGDNCEKFKWPMMQTVKKIRWLHI